jgi:hypothetical protein
MEIFGYIITVLLSFVGIYVGLILAHSAKEELKDIHKYLVLTRFAVLIALAVTFFYALGVNIWIALILMCMFGLTDFYVRSNEYEGTPSFMLYPLFAVASFMTSSKPIFLFLISFFIFALGILIGTIITEKNIQHKMKTFFKLTYLHISYIIISIALFYLL